MGKLQDIKAQIDAAKKRMETEGREALHGAFAEFFTKHPRAAGIAWCQYTPYFNDGEECVFCVHEYELKVDPALMTDAQRERYLGENDGEEERHMNYRYGECCAGSALSGAYYADPKKCDDDWRELVSDYIDLKSALDGELLRVVFGDHVKITATPTGFDVSQFDHD